MTERGYEWAVRYAENRIRKMRHVYDEREWTLPGRVNDAMREIENGRLGELIEEAETDPDTYDELGAICAYSVERGDKLPADLQVYAARVLRGELTRPKPKAGRPAGKSGKQRAVWRLVQQIAEHSDLLPTRSEDYDNRSACDAVAEGLRAAGLAPNSYSGVRKAYSAENARIREEDQAPSWAQKG